MSQEWKWSYKKITILKRFSKVNSSFYPLLVFDAQYFPTDVMNVTVNVKKTIFSLFQNGWHKNLQLKYQEWFENEFLNYCNCIDLVSTIKLFIQNFKNRKKLFHYYSSKISFKWKCLQTAEWQKKFQKIFSA